MDLVASFPIALRATPIDEAGEAVDKWMETHLRTELILAALNMAITQRRPQAVIHHSDRGCQYTSYAFGKRCREAGVMPSMGSVGDAYDNAMAESFFASLERELLSRRRFKSQAEAKMAVFEWIEGWYNPHRRHSALGYRSPVNYERVHAMRLGRHEPERKNVAAIDLRGYQHQGPREIAAPGALHAVGFWRTQSKNPLGASARVDGC